MLMDRHQPRLSQADVEKLSGVSQKTISNMLDPTRPGVSSNTLDKVEKVANAFGLTAWHLLIPTLPDDIAEGRMVAELVADYLASPKDARGVIRHTAERERKLSGNGS